MYARESCFQQYMIYSDIPRDYRESVLVRYPQSKQEFDLSNIIVLLTF